MIKDYSYGLQGAEVGPNYGQIGNLQNAVATQQKQSPMDSAFQSLECEQKRLAEIIARLNDRLTPILSSPDAPSKGECPARPRHSAGLVEAIQTQADVLSRQVYLLNEITERIAL